VFHLAIFVPQVVCELCKVHSTVPISVPFLYQLQNFDLGKGKSLVFAQSQDELLCIEVSVTIGVKHPEKLTDSQLVGGNISTSFISKSL